MHVYARYDSINVFCNYVLSHGHDFEQEKNGDQIASRADNGVSGLFEWQGEPWRWLKDSGCGALFLSLPVEFRDSSCRDNSGWRFRRLHISDALGAEGCWHLWYLSRGGISAQSTACGSRKVQSSACWASRWEPLLASPVLVASLSRHCDCLISPWRWWQQAVETIY